MIPLKHSPSAAWENTVKEFLSKGSRKPLIVIIGPTASGKTAFSLRLCQRLEKLGLRPEVVNADSRQFYAFLDIGTAKITEKEMKGIPHHLLSVLDPKEPCTIAWYQEKAKACIDELHREGKLPILVGGSMLYVSSIVDGLTPHPADTELRERLERQFDSDEGRTLHERLSRLDPEAAEGIPSQNKRYLIRALELLELTGTRKSERKGPKKSPYDLLLLGMKIERTQLHERIQKRTEEMLRSGWIEEVESLLKRGYKESDPGMQSIGYKEIATFLRSGGDQKVLAEDIASKVRAYAKRHDTWWRDDKRVHWLATSD